MTQATFILGDALHMPLADKSVDLVFGSPPYMDARTYGIGAVRDCQEWVDWMLDVTTEAIRVSKGLVLWVVAGVQRDLCYWPGCEGLAWEWWKRGNQLWRPCIWWKVDCNDGGTGIPGSGGRQWLRNDWEYVLAFKREGWLPWADNVAMGSIPVCDQIGGEMSNRRADGTRVNLDGSDPWGKAGRGNGGRRQNGNKNIGTNRRKTGEYKSVKRCVNRGADGKRKVNQAMKLMDVTAGHDKDGNTGRADGRPMPKIANPGNCIIVKARVGGGHMGDDRCHENEAPFPEDLAEFFVRSFCPPGGTVLDPFSGSGTTVAVAVKHGRNGIGVDIRPSQIELGKRRLAEVQPELYP